MKDLMFDLTNESVDGCFSGYETDLQGIYVSVKLDLTSLS